MPMAVQILAVKIAEAKSGGAFVKRKNRPQPVMYRKYGTSEMQEHIFDACTGSTVRRKCRVISVFRNAKSLAFRRYHAIASGDGRGIFSTHDFTSYLLFGLKNQGARCFCSGYNWFIDSASYKRPFTMLYFTLSLSIMFFSGSASRIIKSASFPAFIEPS